MNKLIYRNILSFLLLLFLQIYIFNNIGLFGYLNPYVYVLFILLLPLEIPRSLLLILAFLMGLSIDYFSNTIGINIAASVLIAYLRPGLIRVLSQKIDLDPGLKIGIRDFGFAWFFSYTTVLVVIHHLALFYLEVFRFNEFFDTLRRSLLSAIFTIIIIILSQYLFYPHKKH